MFFILFVLVQQVDTSVRQMGSDMSRPGYQPEDTDTALQHVKSRIDLISRTEQQQLIILGLTMYRAWPSIERWVDGGDLRDWTVTCHILAPDFIRRHADVFDDEWATLAASYGSQIRRQSVHAQERHRTTLRVQQYEHVPAVHGFRLGSGDVFLSFAHWDARTNKLASPNRFFEFYPGDDKSLRAEAYRALFDNWVAKASRANLAGPLP
jgi:hypothetical protein